MNNFAYEYFEDLKANGVVERIRNYPKNRDGITMFQKNAYNIQQCKIHGTPNKYYIKQTSIHRGITSSVVSDMYNELGILTPPMYLVKIPKSGYINTIQQDVCTLHNINAVLAHAVKDYSSIANMVYGKYKWNIFYDMNLRNYFLKFMTVECFNQLKNMFLSSELRTDIDGHLNNYFLYKKQNEDKFTGIIPIDLEEMRIFDFCNGGKSEFNNFLYIPYYTETPQQNNDYASYSERVRDIREVIQDGVMNENNIKTLKSLLDYDFPGNIKKKCNEHFIMGEERRKSIDTIKRLWEYNRKTIGKDLGI